MLAEGVCTPLYKSAAGRSRAANHMVTEGVCTALHAKLNLAVRQLSLAQQQRAFSHFSPSTTTLLAWKTGYSLTESTTSTKEMFVSPPTVRRSSWRLWLDKSTARCFIFVSINNIFKGSVERSSLPWAIFLIFTRNRPWKSEDHLCTLFFIKMSKESLEKSERTPPVSWRPWALAYSRDRPYNFSCL